MLFQFLFYATGNKLEFHIIKKNYEILKPKTVQKKKLRIIGYCLQTED
jgi:hypothetical protein